MLNGKTRVVPILGHPVAQVQSPALLTAAFHAAGYNAVCLPLDVVPDDFSMVVTALARVANLDGFVVTVPHKLACFDHCHTVTERAAFARAVNVVRRDPDGGLHGDMCDGVGLVAAAQKAGCVFAGRQALLFGAGGAGIAIAHAMIEAGVQSLAVCDTDLGRRNALVERLASLGPPVLPSDGIYQGETIIINATPIGMGTTDLPFRVDMLGPHCFVGDVVTLPARTALIEAASQRGCGTVSGIQMYDAVGASMLAFLLDPTRGHSLHGV